MMIDDLRDSVCRSTEKSERDFVKPVTRLRVENHCDIMRVCPIQAVLQNRLLGSANLPDRRGGRERTLNY